jgi:hypothetical protein
MNKTTRFYFHFYILSKWASQETKEFRGKSTLTKPATKVEVINATAKNRYLTDAEGKFTIKIKLMTILVLLLKIMK